MAIGRTWTPDNPCSSFAADVWNHVSNYELTDAYSFALTRNPDILDHYRLKI